MSIIIHSLGLLATLIIHKILSSRFSAGVGYYISVRNAGWIQKTEHHRKIAGVDGTARAVYKQCASCLCDIPRGVFRIVMFCAWEWVSFVCMCYVFHSSPIGNIRQQDRSCGSVASCLPILLNFPGRSERCGWPCHVNCELRSHVEQTWCVYANTQSKRKPLVPLLVQMNALNEQQEQSGMPSYAFCSIIKLTNLIKRASATPSAAPRIKRRSEQRCCYSQKTYNRKCICGSEPV